ncbi:hypothetical protein GHK86_07705, partial [Acidimicrobiaceae bacterium USS-CC1]|nr:hypothetical protein [Acidiferrimicrobium australe]
MAAAEDGLAVDDGGEPDVVVLVAGAVVVELAGTAVVEVVVDAGVVVVELAGTVVVEGATVVLDGTDATVVVVEVPLLPEVWVLPTEPVLAWTALPGSLTGCSFSHSSMTALAIGAARVPPWSLTAIPWLGSITATAIVGWAAGAK